MPNFDSALDCTLKYDGLPGKYQDRMLKERLPKFSIQVWKMISDAQHSKHHPAKVKRTLTSMKDSVSNG